MSLWKQALFEVVIEFFVSGTEWTLRSLLCLETLHPFNLLLSLTLLSLLEPLTTFLSEKLIVCLATMLNGHRDRVQFQLFVISMRSINPIYSEQLLCSLCIRLCPSR